MRRVAASRVYVNEKEFHNNHVVELLEAEGAEAVIAKIKSTDVETESLKATNIEATDATVTNITK